MVINELPVGSVVRLGRYSLAHRSDNMFDIDWIKVSKQNDFISQKVLLGMLFDAAEGWTPNYDYSLSNIRQFMNSENINWFHPTHPNDRQQSWVMFENYVRTDISKYAGLLYHFTDGEISLIEKQNGDYLRLPTFKELNGGFQYFKRHGRRSHPVEVYGNLSRDNFKDTMFASYYVLGDEVHGLGEVDRMGQISHTSPARLSGVRPVCKLSGGTDVELIDGNTYKCCLSDEYSGRYFRETQPLSWLLDI